jgi:hypothetical protein
MYANPASSGRRELITTIALAILFGGGIFLFALLILGEFPIAALAAMAAVALVGCLHYFVWGRSLEEKAAANRLPPRRNGQTAPERGASPRDVGR